MRTTIELPDATFRRMKAVAALQGSTIKEFVQRAVEKEIASIPAKKKHRVKLPLIEGAGHVIRSVSGTEIDEFLLG